MRLIDAESLFRFLNDQRVKETGAFSKGLNKGINIARVAVRSEEICPTVDAVPVVHGRWEQARYTEAPLYICSECDKSEFKQHRYCPNCGAKMDGGKQ